METYRNDPFDSGQGGRNSIILAVIVAFHVLLVFALNSSLSTIVTERVFGPIETQIIDEPQDEQNEPPPPPPVVEAPPPFVPPPDILIDLPAPTANTTAISNVTNVKAPPPPPPTKAAVRVKARADQRLLKSGRWEPEIPPSVNREMNDIIKKGGSLKPTLIRCYVNPEGRCERAEILQGGSISRMDEAAIKHAQRVWKFSPATEDGKPVADTIDQKLVWKVE